MWRCPVCGRTAKDMPRPLSFYIGQATFTNPLDIELLCHRCTTWVQPFRNIQRRANEQSHKQEKGSSLL